MFNSAWEQGFLKSFPKDGLFDCFRDLAKTVHNFHAQIFNYWDCPIAITNGYTECANRLIRETNMKGRGYSFDTLRARSLYRKNNLQSIMDSGGLSIGPNVLSNDPLFTTEIPDEELQEAEAQDALAESELVVDEATGEILNQ